MPSARDLLTAARNPASPFGNRVSKEELEGIYAAAKAPVAGEPAGKPIDAEEAQILESLQRSDLTNWSADLLVQIKAELPGLKQGSAPTGGVVALPPKRGHVMYLSPGAGIAADATGARPADARALTAAMHDAAQYLQANFGGANVFAGVDAATKRAVVQQLKDAAALDLSALTSPQREQLLGSMASLAAELVKSIEAVPMSPASNADLQALKNDAFGALTSLLDDGRMSVFAKRSLVGYLAQSQSFLGKLAPAQKAEIEAKKAALFPQSPADYAQWERDGKDVIVLDHVAGGGENFLFGFVKELQSEGLDKNDPNAPKFTMVSGDARNGPAVLRAVVPAGHPMNQWGRQMTIECRVREMYGTDMYKAMGDASVDVVHYGGHSNFGNNTLGSLKNAPAQNGPKIVARDLCCGADTKNVEAEKYPEASLNSVTSVSSSYFRTTDDPTVGKYAYESEGYQMLMGITRGLLGKKDWNAIGKDLEQRANWPGHDSKNNWTWPTDARAGSFLDDDKDGVPNVFDVLPSYDTTDVAASTAEEFALTIPAEKADQIAGGRAWRAIQSVNTATNYNPIIQPYNKQRLVAADPTGVWFDAKDDPAALVKFSRGPGGERFAQLSTALAKMTTESLRAVVYFELVRELAKENPRLFPSSADAVAMGLLFAATSLEYDDSWRDAEVFAGLAKLYNIPSSVSFSDVDAAVGGCGDRHNYTGDRQALNEVLAKHKAALSGAGVGVPARVVV
jgi:hypothetical protein